MPLRGEALPKPEPLAKSKRRTKRLRFLARRKCRETVYLRESMICQRCGKLTKHPRECWEGDPDRAEVNEPEGRGNCDYTDPDRCELTCAGCHRPNGIHAPTAERLATLKAKGIVP